jgi:hypothetical protein
MKRYRIMSSTRSGSIAAILVAGAVLAGCDREGARRAAEANDTGQAGGSRVTVDSAAGSTDPSPQDPMQGMDHSKMAGAPPTSRTDTAMGRVSGMDHSKMGRSSAAADMTAMEHAKMSGAARPNAPRPGTGGMPGMAHGAEMRPTQSEASEDTSMVKLRRLIAGLVADSVVRTRILADSFLRNRWQDSVVRRILLPPR